MQRTQNAAAFSRRNLLKIAGASAALHVRCRAAGRRNRQFQSGRIKHHAAH